MHSQFFHVTLQQQIAKQLRDVHFGGNWTAVNLKDQLAGVNWQHAITKVQSFNTIAVLVSHMNYYIDVVSRVIQGKPLVGKDKDSFNLPPVQSDADWQELLNKVWKDAEDFAALIEQMPEQQLWEPFATGKYGNVYRNITGIIEHMHYHLGQIVLLKKMIAQTVPT
jgi:hypothetical protein